MTIDGKKLVVVSNRLPVAIYKDEQGWKVKSSSGGLVTALTPIMEKTNGIWIGWPGCSEEAPAENLLKEFSEKLKYTLKPIMITQKEVEHYYLGFSNNTIWPLFHDLLGQFSFDYEDWNTYIDVNRRCAEEIAGMVDKESFLWIHDYHFLLLALFLKESRPDLYLNFFRATND